MPDMTNGLALAIVTNNQDPEGLGRVCVTFPALSASFESDWVPVASPMAGKNYGFVMIPEVGGEVVVGFLHGNITSPVVLGSLWNVRTPPPIANSNGRNDERVIHSRDGHRVYFNDDPDGAVEIGHREGHKVRLGRETVIVQDSGGSRIEFDSASGSITIEAVGKLIIRAAAIETHVDDE